MFLLIVDALLVLLIFATPAQAQAPASRLEAGGLATFTFLEEIGTRDVGPGTEAAGFGGRLVYRPLSFLDLETDIVFLPGNPASTGNILQGLFGVKAGPRFSRVGFFAKARPGFIHFRRDPFGVGKPGAGLFSRERAHSTEPSLDLGGVLEFYTTRGWILRLDAGKNIIRYSKRLVRVSQLEPEIPAGGFTTRNVQVSFGVGFRL